MIISKNIVSFRNYNNQQEATKDILSPAKAENIKSMPFLHRKSQ